MSGHTKRYPKGAGEYCETCHAWGGNHLVGCPEDDMDEDFPVERDTETLDAFDFIEQQEQGA